MVQMVQLGHPSFQGMKSRTGTLDSLLEELSEHHSQAGQALLHRHLEEINHSGLSPELTVPKQPQHFLEELPHQLSLCLLGSQSPGCDLSEQQVSLGHFLGVLSPHCCAGLDVTPVGGTNTRLASAIPRLSEQLQYLQKFKYSRSPWNSLVLLPTEVLVGVENPHPFFIFLTETFLGN